MPHRAYSCLSPRGHVWEHLDGLPLSTTVPTYPSLMKPFQKDAWKNEDQMIRVGTKCRHILDRISIPCERRGVGESTLLASQSISFFHGCSQKTLFWVRDNRPHYSQHHKQHSYHIVSLVPLPTPLSLMDPQWLLRTEQVYPSWRTLSLENPLHSNRKTVCSVSGDRCDLRTNGCQPQTQPWELTQVKSTYSLMRGIRCIRAPETQDGLSFLTGGIHLPWGKMKTI